MKNKIVSVDEAIAHIQDGMTIMFGGFLGVGSAHTLIDALVEKNVKDLTIIGNDTGFVDVGIGKLVANKQVKKVIASHIGTNKETGRQMSSGETEVILVPQGTLAEQVRAGGTGLGGFLTPTGVGTIVEEGKEVLTIDGKKYLLEMPLRADIALVGASKADKKGNCYFAKTTKNFNPLIALASDTVLVEAEEIVEVGQIDPELVMVPGEVVTCITQKEVK